MYETREPVRRNKSWSENMAEADRKRETWFPVFVGIMVALIASAFVVWLLQAFGG